MNVGARLELGRYPVTLNIIKRTLNYWLKLEDTPSGSLLNSCLLSEKELSDKKIKSWYSYIETILQTENNVKNNPSKKGVQISISKLKEQYDKDSLENLTVSRSPGEGSKLRTYGKIKNTPFIERYLLNPNLSWNQKKIIAKFRLGDHKLHIETGRHCRPKIPPDKRICQLCCNNEVEDELHFLLVCPVYANIRDKYSILETVQTAVGIKFIELLTSTDTTVLLNVSKYLSEAFDMRSTR